jgi:hypothetical protein
MANRYWVSGGTGNWNSTTNWSTTSGGLSGATVPSIGIAGDDVFFDNVSGVGTATVNTTGLGCKSINLTSFSGTLGMTNTLQVWGNVTIGAGMVTTQITGAGSFTITANSTFDILSGFKIPNISMNTTLGGVAVTITLVRDTTITNFTGTFGSFVFRINRTSAGNGDNLFIEGNFVHNGGNALGGTATLNFISSGSSTLSNNINTENNVVFNATGSYTGSLYKFGGTLVRTAGNVSLVDLTIYTTTITSNGAIWRNVVSPAINTPASTITTNDDLICTGVFSQFSSFGVTWVHNGGSAVRMRGTVAQITSINLSIIFDGSQNCTINSGNQMVGITLTMNPFPGCQLTITSLGGLFADIFNSTITYLDTNGGPTPRSTGPVYARTGNTFNTSPSSTKFIIWNSVDCRYTAPWTLTSDFHVSGTTNTSGGGSLSLSTSNGSKYYMGGTSLNDGGLSGTATVVFYYTGNWAAGSISNNLVISSNTGQTYTITSLTKGGVGSTITYTAGGGTINTTSGTLFPTTNITMATSGVLWGNITTSSGIILTLNQLLSISNNLTFNGSVTFSGSSGWNCSNLLCPTAGSVITLLTGNTYTTTTNVNMLGSSASPITMISSNPTTARATWTLNQGATQSMVYVNGRAIDSSLGQTVWTFGGNITTALVPLNWNVGARPAAYGYIIFN